jgi:hypothetical protein
MLLPPHLSLSTRIPSNPMMMTTVSSFHSNEFLPSLPLQQIQSLWGFNAKSHRDLTFSPFLYFVVDRRKQT